MDARPSSWCSILTLGGVLPLCLPGLAERDGATVSAAPPCLPLYLLPH